MSYGTDNVESCRSRKYLMRKILILAVVAASIGGGLTLRSQNAPEQEGKEVQRVQTNGETARFILDTEPLDRTDRAISYAPVIEQATPAVVTVASSSMVRVLRNRYANPMEEF